jgi:hypothetical protein
LTDLEPEGSSKSVTDAQKLSREKARRKATEVNQAMPIGELQWSTFRGKTLKSGT